MRLALCGISLQSGTLAEVLSISALNTRSFTHIRYVAHQRLRGTARDPKSGHAWRPAAPQSHSPGSEPSEVQFELVIRRPQCSLAHRRDRAISARRCSTKLDCAPPLCEELAPASGNLAIVSPKSSEMRRLFVSEYILESEQASRPSRPPARPHAPAARPWGTPRNA